MSAPADREQNLEDLVHHDRERLAELAEDFLAAWRARETLRALYLFGELREALICHGALTQQICVDTLELLGRRIVVGSSVDDDLETLVAALTEAQPGLFPLHTPGAPETAPDLTDGRPPRAEDGSPIA